MKKEGNEGKKECKAQAMKVKKEKQTKENGLQMHCWHYFQRQIFFEGTSGHVNHYKSQIAKDPKDHLCESAIIKLNWACPDVNIATQ